MTIGVLPRESRQNILLAPAENNFQLSAILGGEREERAVVQKSFDRYREKLGWIRSSVNVEQSRYPALISRAQ
jgi:hypothetical protein